MRHSVLVGLDLFESVQYNELLRTTDPTLATDLYDPSHGPVPTSLLQNWNWSSRNRTWERWAGLYVQDQVQLTDNLYFLAGARYDYVIEHMDNSVYAAPNVPDNAYLPLTGGVNKFGSIKGRGGFLWHPTASLSFYANYIQNFGVNPGMYYSGNGQAQLFQPVEIANEWETGIKLETAGGRASATLAWFDLTKRNVGSSVLEPAIDNLGVAFLMHKATNRGLEVDFHGEILPGLQLLASYAYIDSRVENTIGSWLGGVPKGSELLGQTGNRLAGVPSHGASMWATYRVGAGALRGLKLGVGAVARGTRAGDNLNDYRLPGFAKCNALAAYSWRAAGTGLNVQLNVDNLLDKRYFESLSGTRTVIPGASRNWIATLGVEF
jgi:iron complex outermembrane receptor protein